MELNSQLAPEILELEKSLSIDLAKLINDLAAKKGRKLTEKEQYYLCLSLLGNEPVEIAKIEYYALFSSEAEKNNSNLTQERLQKIVDKRIKIKAAEIRSYMSVTINSYIKELMYEKQEKAEQCDQEKRPNWLKVVCFLRNNGYKKEISSEQEPQNKKILIIEIEAEGNLELKNLVKLLQNTNQRCGAHSLIIRDVSQEGDNYIDSQPS